MAGDASLLSAGDGRDDWRFGPPQAPLDYALGKVARDWFVRSQAPRELQHGITINAVAPGPIEYVTLEDALRHAGGGPEAGEEPTPQHVAEVVAFLCSERARFVTGAVIPVHGNKEV